MKARLLANLNWLLADRIMRIVGGLVIGIWVARYLGPEQFGVLNYALAFVALFGTVAKLGMDQIIVRDLTRRPDQEGVILGTVFLIKLIASLIAIALVIPIAWQVGNKDLSFTIIITVIAASMLFNALDAYEIYFQTHLLSRKIVIARGSAFLLFSGVRIALIVLAFPVVYFAAAATVELALGGLLLAWLYYHNSHTAEKWAFDKTVLTTLLKDGWPLIISSALIVIHTRVDQVMIGQMLGHTDVGIYSAAVRLSESWLFVPTIIVQTVTPYLVKLRETNVVFYHARLLQLYSIMFWLGALTGAGTALFGEFAIVALFGEAYRAAYWPLVLTVWTGIFIAQAVARGIWMIGENMQGFRLANNMLSVPLNIALNWFLIPRYGVIGASVASLLSIGLSTWIFPFLFKPMRASNWQLLRAINPKYLLVR